MNRHDDWIEAQLRRHAAALEGLQLTKIPGEPDQGVQHLFLFALDFALDRAPPVRVKVLFDESSGVYTVRAYEGVRRLERPKEVPINQVDLMPDVLPETEGRMKLFVDEIIQRLAEGGGES